MKRILLLITVAVAVPFISACVMWPHHDDGWSIFPFFMFPFWLMGLALYLLPTIIAAARGKRKIVGIVLLNVLLGWTFIGWVAALIWACLVEE